MRCGIQNAYIIDINIHKMQVLFCSYCTIRRRAWRWFYKNRNMLPSTIINITKFCCVWLIHHCIFMYVDTNVSEKYASYVSISCLEDAGRWIFRNLG